MTSIAVANPYMHILNLSGLGVNNGDLYIGMPSQDPQTYPQAVFADAAPTIPVSQPVPVMGGYPMRFGSPTTLYVAGPYSIRARDSAGVQIWYDPLITSEVLGLGLLSVTNIAAMTALDTLQIAAGQTLEVLGYSAANDGGGGSFYWDAASTATADGGTIFQADSGVVGRWLRINNVGALNVLWFGADKTGTTDTTGLFQAAIDKAYSAGINAVYVPAGLYRVDGTIFMKAGGQLYGFNFSSEYYPSSPYLEKNSTTLLKPAGGVNGPIVEHATGAAISGLYLQHLKIGGATTGIVRMGVTSNTGDLYNAVVQDCQIFGHAIEGGVYTAANCHGIYSPESTIAPTHQRYFCRITNVYVTNCDRGLSLGGQSNGWSITNIVTRQTYRPIYLDGGASEVADTLITGLHAQAIGVLPTAVTAVITLVGAVNVLKVSGISECNGKAYDVTGATSYNQVDFSDYVPNEPIPSDGTVPFSVQISGYAPSTVRGPTWQQLITDPSRTGDALSQGYGVRNATGTKVSGTLPQLNGAVFDTSVNSKCIVQMPASVLSKAAKASFSAKLKVFLSTPAAGGLAVADIDFIYRVTNQSTGAAMLSVERTVLKGGQIVALGFVSGKTAGTGFRIGVTGATGGAVVANALTVVLEIDAVTYDANIIAMNDFDNIAYVSTTPTADDVTDFVSLLAVADTVI